MEWIHLFRPQVSFIVTLTVLCVLATLVDLGFGVFKAKLRGEKIVSERLRDTVVKLVLYVCLQCLLAFVDYAILCTLNEYNQQCAWNVPLFPIVSSLGGIIILCIEILSMVEHADKKTRKSYEKVINTAANVIKNHKDAEAILEYMSHQIQKEKQQDEEDI